MSDNLRAKGMRVREKVFDNGESAINLTIDLTQIGLNPIYKDKFVKIKLVRGKKAGMLYPTNDKYYQDKQERLNKRKEQNK